MVWKDVYEKRKMTAQDAVKQIRNGERVAFGHAAAEPLHLVRALAENYEQYQNVEICHLVTMDKGEYLKPHMQGHFIHNGTFLGASTRDSFNLGHGDFTPCFFYQVPELYRKYKPVDVALISVTPPDERGYVSLGVSCDFSKSIAEHSRLTIAQVNDQMPRCLGDNFLHVSDIDIFVEHSEAIPEIPVPVIDDVKYKIGQYCASLIEDGDTLQLGIGAIPDAVLQSLKDKKDLGIHSEMISDGVIDLVESGVINGKKKTLHTGKIVTAFLMGTKRLYDFVDDNMLIEMHGVDYVNNPVVIMQNDNMVSVNSCMEMDLMGQVCSESVGSAQFSGVGGQVDFIRGAALAKNGRAILAFPSSASKGKISKIVPRLKEGTPVTTSRNDVDYAVTEYGIAPLRGRSLKERAKALIQIAHPNFRESLSDEYERFFREKLSM